uniref:non-ribosomal peptide synthetase n=1 Tax=uncultured Kordia sp. TaxID=507699 RepID=UPI002625A9AF
KISGNRIELGEIEVVLQEAPQVVQGAVLVKEEDNVGKRLVGYIEVNESYSKESLKEYLEARLPAHMIPSIFVEMEAMPLTPSGKIDRKALPDTDISGLLQENYVGARNELEEGLIRLWQNLLNIPKIGIDDNFFELGGDSIITIQLVSRAKREGYKFSPKDVFEYQTIRKLSDNLQKESTHTISTEQGILEGEFEMLPIQRLFFEDAYPENTHYNQSLLLNVEKTVSYNDLETIVNALIERHDTFRLAFEKTGNTWQQRYTKKVGVIQHENISETTTAKLSSKITEICESYQSSLTLGTAEIAKFVFIQTPASEDKNRLFIVAHHLTIDGVSWRIILDDINESLEQISNNKPIQLGKKGSSYRQFSQALANYAKSNQIAAQQYYWETIATNVTPLPIDHKNESSVVSDIESYRISLDEKTTQILLKEVHQTYTTEMNDILLSALLGSITNHFLVDKITIGIEGHGREDLFNQLDISGTVGWFTNVYPLVLNASEVNSVSDLIKSTKEQIREVPEKGIGYGILRYMSDDEVLQKSLANISWDIEFNYLGQLDNALTSNNWLSAASEHPGENLHKNTPHKTRLDVNSFIADGELQLSFGYSKRNYSAETIETIANAYITKLKAIIEHCVAENKTIKTPSDYELQGKVSYQELDAFFAKAGDAASEISTVYELSPMQEGMLFHGLYDDSSISYTNQIITGFPSGLDVENFKKSCNHVLKNYSILRSGFFYENISTPIQAVYNTVEMPIEIIDYSQLPEEEIEQKVTAFIEKDQKTNFDFNQPPLMRITLLKLHDGSYKMVWTHHHIILDGWSMPILMKELLETYESFSQGVIPVHKKEDIYQEYIQYIQAKNKKEEETHWRNYLSDLEEGTLLPFINDNQDRNKGVGDFQSDYLSFDASFTTQLKNYCKTNHITANTLMQGAWAYLLGQYTAKEKVVYGVTVSGRPSDFENTEKRIGLYINTIPLYTTIDYKQSVIDFLTEIQKGHTTSREYQYSALSDVKKWSNIQDEFFDSLFVFENYPVDEVLDEAQSTETTAMDVQEKTNYPITIEAVLANTLKFKIDYNASMLATKDVNRIKNHLQTLLKSFLTAEKVADLQYLTIDEHTELLDVFNTTSVEYPQKETIISLFESQVVKTPNAVAAVYEDQKLTYKQLDAQSNQLAHYLREKGVKEETFVPICVERSLHMIVGMLAIVKAGGVYVPIDPIYPQERVDFILNDLKAEIVVTANAFAEFFSENIEVLELDTISETLESYSTGKTKNTIKSDQLLYVIYTSGTTGTPKGVLITHENVVRLFYNEDSLFDFDEKDVWSMFHSYNFDFSVWEMYGALLFGGKLVIVPKSYTKDPDLFGSLLSNEGVTILNQTPSSFSVLQERVLQNKLDLQVRYVIFGGEALHPQIVKNWKETYTDCKMINMYGITETTVHVTYKEITEKEIASNQSNIGVPIPTLGCVILDDSQKLVPTGVQGELYVSGAGLARGYLNREELTKERFVTLKIGEEAKRYYRSGDLAKINTDGELEYLGRKDDQVKIRGYRIELGEIDSVLNKSDLIKKGITLAQKDTSGIARLLSYIIPAKGYDKTEVLSFLRATLPSYMVPAILVELDEFPITSNGKIDKKNLLKRETIANSTVEFVAPRNPIEENLSAMWKKVLKIHKISIHDNFFEIGGNSIDVIKLVSEIQKEYEIDISLRVLFDINTIADLAKYIKLVQLETEDKQNSKIYDL